RARRGDRAGERQHGKNNAHGGFLSWKGAEPRKQRGQFRADKAPNGRKADNGPLGASGLHE
ncbi:MAG: hypothetical protein ACK5X3_21795, partial [Pseudomonadota bacterium]